VEQLDQLSARTRAAKDHLAHVQTLATRAKQATLAAAFRGELTADWRVLNDHPVAAPASDATAHHKAEIDAWETALEDWETSGRAGKRPAKPRKSKPPEVLSEEQTKLMWDLPVRWAWVQIGEGAFVTKLAGFEYTKLVNYTDEGDLSVLKAENVGLNGFRPTDYSKVVSMTVSSLTRSQIFGGEVLVVFVGAGVGNVGAVPEGARFFLGPNIGMVRPYGNGLNSKFLEYFLRSRQGKDLLLAEAKAVAQPSISMGAIRNTPVPICSDQEQSEIVRRIEAAFARIDRMVTEATRAAELLERLEQQLLAKAFRGELVSQDPADEPASALLARVREARAKAPKPKRTRKRAKT
jgi:type I restriction enzyme S subunit